MLQTSLEGATAGIIIALSGLINGATETETRIVEFAVMFDFNDPIKALFIATLCATTGAFWGYAGSHLFKNFKILRVEELDKINNKTVERTPEDPAKDVVTVYQS